MCAERVGPPAAKRASIQETMNQLGHVQKTFLNIPTLAPPNDLLDEKTQKITFFCSDRACFEELVGLFSNFESGLKFAQAIWRQRPMLKPLKMTGSSQILRKSSSFVENGAVLRSYNRTCMICVYTQLSPLHTFAKVLYPRLGIELLWPPVLYGSYRTGPSNFAWLWPLGRAHKGKNSKIQAFYAAFWGIFMTPSCQTHGSPPECSRCVSRLPQEFNQE